LKNGSDVAIHAARWIRKVPWPSWPHRRGFTGGRLHPPGNIE